MNNLCRILVFAFCVIILAPALLAFAEVRKKVLIIESYHSEYPWDKSYMRGINDTLGAGYEILTFQMDTKRVPQEQYQQQADKAWNYFMETKPDLVVLGDDNALKFLSKKIDDTGTPIVFLGINSNPRDVGIFEMKNITGILERPLFNRNIIAMNNIMDNKLNRLLVLFDSGNTSKAAIHEAFKNKKMLKLGKVKADLKLIGNKTEWQETVLNAKKDGYDAIVVGLYHTITDDEGNHVPANEILGWTSANTPVPPFAFWDFAVGKNKSIGGFVLFGREQGIAAANLVKKVLDDGVNPSDILPIVAKKGRFYFSENELNNWKLSLPKSIAAKASLID